MTRRTIALLTSAAMVIGSAVTVSALGKKGSPKPTHVTTSKPTTTKVSSPKTTSGPKKTTTTSQVSKGPKATKPTTVKATKTTKTTKTAPATKSAKATKPTTSTKAAKTEKSAAPTKSVKTEKTEKTSTTTTKTTTTSGDGDTPVTLTKVQEKLQKNTKLADKLTGRLPDGTDLMEAAKGFKNLGQFVAAVNVSNNLGLDFDKLKTAMVDDGKSLGQAIQTVKRDVESPTIVAQKAETEANTLIRETERQLTTTTTTTTTTKTKSKDKPKRTLRTQSAS